MDIFVKKDDFIKIDVYVFDDKVTIDEEEVPADVEPATLAFEFRKPNHADSTFLTSSSVVLDEKGIKDMNVVKFQDLAFRRLLVKWNLTNNGDSVPVSNQAIDELNPDIVRTVAGQLLGSIKI